MIIGCRAVAWQLLFCPAAAVTYDCHASEDHQRRHYFLPGKGIHADADADYDGNDWLDITVHAHKGRSDAFLTKWYEKIGYECGADNKIGQFGQLDGRDCRPVQVHDFIDSKRSGDQKSKEEYPFHECYYGIFADQRLEYSQIHRKAETVQYNHEYSEQGGFRWPSDITCLADYQIYDASKTYGDTSSLL